jgi:hypothetical protein
MEWKYKPRRPGAPISRPRLSGRRNQVHHQLGGDGKMDYTFFVVALLVVLSLLAVLIEQIKK